MVSTLGPAAASSLPDLNAQLRTALTHADIGVRMEAAAVGVAVARSVPVVAREWLPTMVHDLLEEHGQLIQLGSAATTEEAKQPSIQTASGFRGLAVFRSRPDETLSSNIKGDLAAPHQWALHGMSLFISLFLKYLPSGPGGLPSTLVDTVASAAEVLLQPASSNLMLSPDSMGASIRAGFTLLSGILTLGPEHATTYAPLVFSSWKSVSDIIVESAGKSLTLKQQLLCMDAVLHSVLVFLHYNSELLLDIPEALSKTTLLLESAVSLFGPQGRLASLSKSHPELETRVTSASASLLEAFAWLPSGSFPMVADDVFRMAANEVMSATTTTSLLPSLVDRSDTILDRPTIVRARRSIVGAVDLDESILMMATDKLSLPQDRDGILLLRDGLVDKKEEVKRKRPPTPLHQVGTWRRPFDPSYSSVTRLVDAAIQAYAATFGLKSGKEQQDALTMLQTLEGPALSNRTAALLSCLQALPLTEATHNVPIGLGPQWMNKAKDLLLSVVSSASTLLRRAAAEGLALVATVGVTEDARFLQSSVLHSLEERRKSSDPAARAGSILALGFIQRTTRSLHKGADSSELPLLNMMTRILPSCGREENVVVRIVAVHTFGTLLKHSGWLDGGGVLTSESMQVLRKVVELVQYSFIASWTACTLDLDKGQETEKMSTEASLLAVLSRLMAFLVPYLSFLTAESPQICRQFSEFASIAIETHGSHPTVFVEAMSFFRALALNQNLLPPPATHVLPTENPLESCIPAILQSFSPYLAAPGEKECDTSIISLRSAVSTIRCFTAHGVEFDATTVSHMVALLERSYGSCRSIDSDITLALAAGLETERLFQERMFLGTETFETILEMSRRRSDNASERLHWMLWARAILTGSRTEPMEGTAYDRFAVMHMARLQAQNDVGIAVDVIGSSRWQVKTLAARILLESLESLRRDANTKTEEMERHFSFKMANQRCTELCREAESNNSKLPFSSLIFHLQEFVSCACMNAVASVEQAELYAIQESSVRMLNRLVEYFVNEPDPEEPAAMILDQYSTQVFSVVKHALVSHQEHSDPGAHRLLIAGCELLQTILDVEMTKDPMILKRLIRPIVLVDLNFVPYNSDPADLLKETLDQLPDGSDHRSALVSLVGKIWMTGRLLLGTGELPEVRRKVCRDLFKESKALYGLAIHSAAAALDGVRLLRRSSWDLTGRGGKRKDSDWTDDTEKEPRNGYFFSNVDNIDDLTRAMLVCQWPSLASCSIQPLIQACASAEEKGTALSWINVLTPLFFAGVEDACRNSRNDQYTDSHETTTEAHGMKPHDVLVQCLRGISQLLSADVDCFDGCDEKLDTTVKNIYESILQPFFVSSKQTKLPPLPVAKECYKFIRRMSSSSAQSVRKDGALLMALIAPLEYIQKDQVALEGNEAVQLALTTSFLGLASFLQGESPVVAVETVLGVALKTVAIEKGSASQVLHQGIKHVLTVCLQSGKVSLGAQKHAAKELALAKSWDHWTDFASLGNDEVVADSVPLLQECLSNQTNLSSQLEALSATSKLLQRATSAAGSLFFALGGECMVMFYKYGSCQINMAAREFRTQACAESMKVLLLAFQYLSTSDEDLIPFLQLFFEALSAVLRYNGIPNHPSPPNSPFADPTLGRLCAQAMLHVARATPDPFKQLLTMLPKSTRVLVEFSVRAEMNGYVATPQQQQRQAPKKISLTGFK